MRSRLLGIQAEDRGDRPVRNPDAQVNEIPCKLIAYNLTVVVHEMFENGIAPSFVKQNSAA